MSRCLVESAGDRSVGFHRGARLRRAALAWSGQEGPDWALRALHTGIARATRIWGMISHVLDAGLELDAVLDLDRWLADRDDAALMMAIAGNTKPSMLQELERTRATERRGQRRRRPACERTLDRHSIQRPSGRARARDGGRRAILCARGAHGAPRVRWPMTTAADPVDAVSAVALLAGQPATRSAGASRP